MRVRADRRRLVRLFSAFATAVAVGSVWAAPASAAPAGGSAAPLRISWGQAGVQALVLPPPHEPDRGSCLATRNGTKIRLDCVIKKEDTTLWVACSGGFVEIRHLNPPGVTAEGTCPTYGGYALTYTGP
ncbi:hypothetical protein [Micromonospora zhanjiangensis]|uniref:Uncharacterized protein n=1 Tax=Micromonospora zhanjiangensis TaxID=1522057 RepID=A0ABV8KWE3_9ACTN